MAIYATTATTFAIQTLYWGGSGAVVGTAGAANYGAPPAPTDYPIPRDLPASPQTVNPTFTELALAAAGPTTYTKTGNAAAGPAAAGAKTVQLAPPTGVDAGLDATVRIGDAFARTGVATNATSYAWTVTAGPEAVGTVVSTAAAVSWRPLLGGTYTLRLDATNAGGTTSDTVDVVCSVGAGTGPRWLIVTGTATAPAAGDLTLRDRLIDTLGQRVSVIRDDNDAQYAGGGFDAVYVSDSSSGGTVAAKYAGLPVPLFHGELGAWNAAGVDALSVAYTDTPTTAAVVFTAAAVAAGVAGATGTTTLFTAAVNLPNIAPANIAGGAQQVAMNGGTTTNVAAFLVESGAALLNAHTAEARRVFYRVPNGSFSAQNAAGLAFFDALVGWLLAAPQTYTKTGTGAAAPAAAGTKVRTTAATYTKAGTAAGGAQAAGTETTAAAPYPLVVRSVGFSASSGAVANSGTLPGGAAAAGNLLVFALAGDKNPGALTMSDNIGGAWTKPIEVLGASVSTYLAFKVAVGGETTITGTTPTASVSGNRGWVGELAQSGTGSWALLGSSTPAYSDVTATSRDTGSTAAVAADGLGIAIATMDSVSAVPSVSWTGGYATASTSPTLGLAAPAGLWVALAQVDAAATSGTTFSYTGANADQIHAAVAVFGRSAAATTYSKTGTAAAVGAAAGVQVRTTAATYPKTGAGAAAAAAAGVQVRTTAAVVAKTGVGAAGAAASGGKVRTTAATYTKTGSGAGGAAAAGVQVRTSAAVVAKTGAGAVGAAATGAKTLAAAAVVQKAGTAAAAGAPTGGKGVTRTKAGTAAAPAAAAGTKAVTAAAVYSKTGAAAAAAAAAGGKSISAAGAVAKSGAGVSAAAAAATKSVTRTEAGTGAAGAAAAGSRSVTSAAGVVKTGAGAAAGAATGVKSVVSPAGVVKTGTGVVGGAGTGARAVTRIEAGTAAAGAAAAGSQSRVAAAAYLKAGAAAAAAAATGTRTTTAPQVVVKTGSGAVAGVAAGTKVVTSGWRYAGSATSLSGPWANTPAAVGPTQGDTATWTTSGGGTAVLELAGFGLEQVVPAGAVVQQLGLRVRTAVPQGTVDALTAQCYVGATPVGAAQPLVVDPASHEDVITVTGVAYDDLPDLRVQISATRAGAADVYADVYSDSY